MILDKKKNDLKPSLLNKQRRKNLQREEKISPNGKIGPTLTSKQSSNYNNVMNLKSVLKKEACYKSKT
jgi:hypothetical protein